MAHKLWTILSMLCPGRPGPGDDGLRRQNDNNWFVFKFIKWLLHGLAIHLQFNKNEENEMLSR